MWKNNSIVLLAYLTMAMAILECAVSITSEDIEAFSAGKYRHAAITIILLSAY